MNNTWGNSPRYGQGGYTLMEILVVVLLLSISLGVFMGFNFSQRDSYKLKSAARQVYGFFRASRAFAVIDSKDNVVSYSPGSLVLKEELRDKSLKLPEGVRVRISDDPEEGEENETVALARFYADGSAQAVRVRLMVKEKSMLVRIDPVLGEASIVRDGDEQ